MKPVSSVLLAVLLGGCGMFGPPKTVGPALTGEQIKELLVGNTIQGPLSIYVYDWYYTQDGKVRGDVGLMDKDSGTWLVKGTGTYCHQWMKFFHGAQRCYEWYKLEQSSHYLMESLEPAIYEDIEVSEIIEGNPYNL